MTAQEEKFECGFTVTNDEFKALIQQVPAIKAHAANATPPSTTEDIPVRFTIFRDDDGDYSPSGDNIGQADLNFAIQTLNTAYASLGFNFVQCGDPLYVNNSGLYDHSASGFYGDYSYVSSAINVYIRNTGSASNATLPSVTTGPNNVVVYDFQKFRNSDHEIAHEVGHHFNLLHTHGVERLYNIPPLETPSGQTPQIDHPYEGEFEMNRRELLLQAIITDPFDERIFRRPNCDEAGDLVCDTPPGCSPRENHRLFYPNSTDPNCFPLTSSTCTSGCTSTSTNGVLTYTGNYKDYNLDFSPVQVDNTMSYFGGLGLTDGQKDRIMEAYEMQRMAEYEPTLCGNLKDKVEFEGTPNGLDRVHIQFEHPNDDRYCNTLTSPDNSPSAPIGTFNGKFYDTTVKANVRKLGKGPNLEYIYDSNNDGVNDKNEWLDGISTFDMVRIQKHVLNISPLTSGYSKLAADVNNSRSITTFDIVLLRKLILGINETFPAFNQPWRFIPEYIPQNHASAFNNNPFNITALGAQGLSTVYTTPNGITPSPNGNNGKSGFDAVKIGDVNGSNTENLCNEDMDLVWYSGLGGGSSIPVNKDEEVTVLVKGIATNNVLGFQIGIDFSDDDFELVQLTGLGVLYQLESSHFSTKNEGKTQKIKTAWIDETLNGVNFGSQGLPNGMGQELFKVKIKAKQNIADLTQSIHLIDDKLFVPNFYDTNGCVSSTSLELKKVPNGINLESSTGNGLMAQEQLRCFPNPFTNELKVVLDLEAATSGKLVLQDAFGKVLLQQNATFHEGRNILTLEDFSHFSSGLMILSIQTDQQVYSVKTIRN